MIKNKIFVIGFNKTATRSIHTLFKAMLLRSYHGPEWRDLQDINLLNDYDCFSDGPPDDFVRLDKLFPGSKFILNVRNLDKWVYSRLAHIDLAKRNNTHVGSITWDCTEYAIKEWIRQRNSYHISVLSYFSDRPSDLLVINYIRDKSASNKIVKFLGYNFECENFMVNVNSEKPNLPKYKEMLSTCINELGISRNELEFDILCPNLLTKEQAKIYPYDTELLELTLHRASPSGFLLRFL